MTAFESNTLLDLKDAKIFDIFVSFFRTDPNLT